MSKEGEVPVYTIRLLNGRKTRKVHRNLLMKANNLPADVYEQGHSQGSPPARRKPRQKPETQNLMDGDVPEQYQNQNRLIRSPDVTLDDSSSDDSDDSDVVFVPDPTPVLQPDSVSDGNGDETVPYDETFPYEETGALADIHVAETAQENHETFPVGHLESIVDIAALDDDDESWHSIPESDTSEYESADDGDSLDVPEESVVADITNVVPAVEMTHETVHVADIADATVPVADETVPVADIADETVPVADLTDVTVPGENHMVPASPAEDTDDIPAAAVETDPTVLEDTENADRSEMEVFALDPVLPDNETETEETDALINFDSDCQLEELDLINLDSDAIIQSETDSSVEGEESGEEEVQEDGEISIWNGDSEDDDVTVLQFEDAVETLPVMDHHEVTTPEFVTPVESPAELSDDEGEAPPVEAPAELSEEPTDEGEVPQDEASRAQQLRRSNRIRRGRSFLSYKTLGNPHITRYTMYPVKHKP